MIFDFLFFLKKAKMEAEMEARGGGDMASGGGGGGDAGGDGGQDAVDESIDPYELMEPAEILSKLPKDFKEKLVSDYFDKFFFRIFPI